MDTITTIESYLKLLNQYGWPAVFFLYGFFMWFVPWIKGLIDRSNVDDDEQDNIIEAVGVESDIQTLLAQISSEFGCNWAVIWQFHNGTVSIGGRIPFIKMSVTNEFRTPDVESRGQKYQNLPISLFIDSLIDIAEKGYIRATDDSKRYSTIAQAYRVDGVKSGYFVKITNERGLFIGVLSISFSDDVTLSDSDIDTLKEYSHRFSIILSMAASKYHTHKYRRRWND